MKCDELKSLKNIECAFNTTSQQDQVIAEDSEGNCYGFDSWEEVYLKDEVDAAIAELKTKLVEQEVENRRLKRALWLARANKAESESRGWYHSNAYIIKYDGLHNIKGVLYGKGFKRYPGEWMKLWIKIERLCLAKAEEYK